MCISKCLMEGVRAVGVMAVVVIRISIIVLDFPRLSLSLSV